MSAPRRRSPHGVPGREKAAEAKAAQVALETGPSLLVLAGVEHLPVCKGGESKPGGHTGSTPRSEWSPIAGRRLRLVTVPDLAAARATLVTEFPDDASVIDAILGPLATKAYVSLPPILLLGPPAPASPVSRGVSAKFWAWPSRSTGAGRVGFVVHRHVPPVEHRQGLRAPAGHQARRCGLGPRRPSTSSRAPDSQGQRLLTDGIWP